MYMSWVGWCQGVGSGGGFHSPNELAVSPGVLPLTVMGGVGVREPEVGFMVVMTICSSTLPSMETRGSLSAAKSSTRSPL